MNLALLPDGTLLIGRDADEYFGIAYPCVRCGGETGEPLREYCDACLEPSAPDVEDT